MNKYRGRTKRRLKKNKGRKKYLKLALYEEMLHVLEDRSVNRFWCLHVRITN